MKNYFFLSVLISLTASLNAQPVDESPADLTICNLDGKLMATAQQVCSYSMQLTAGMYVVTVNGESRKFRI